MTLACRGGWRWNEGVRGTLSGRYGYSAHISFGSCKADNISLLIISSYPHRIAVGCGPTDHIPSFLPSARLYPTSSPPDPLAIPFARSSSSSSVLYSGCHCTHHFKSLNLDAASVCLVYRWAARVYLLSPGAEARNICLPACLWYRNCSMPSR